MKQAFYAGVAALLGACAATPPAPPAPPAPPPPSVNVFAVAHQDDWQLFMNPTAYHGMDEPQEKAVFIHVTAGDAGAGLSGDPVPYYLAREEGVLRAVRFMANAADPSQGRGVKMDTSIATHAGHPVQRHAYANAVIYFLRLPDGNLINGKIVTPNPLAIEKLRMQQIPAAPAIDNSTIYTGWDDLVATLASIVEAERTATSALNLHIAEADQTLNPKDHPDHRATALAMETVAAVHRHDEYATRGRPVNVTGKNYMIDVGTWAATASGLSDNGAKPTWEAEHNSWIGVNYYRSTPPAGSCSAKAP